MNIRDRIKELRRVRASELLRNKRNWRRHPKAQEDAMRDVLNEIGYADVLLARETPDGLEIIDGHLRASLTPDQEVPVVVLDVTEEEAKKILLTLDPLAAMAIPDMGMFGAGLMEVSFEGEGVNAMLTAMADGSYQSLAPKPGGAATSGLTDPDEALAPQGAPWVKRGAVFRLGDHRVMCGDATLDLRALMAGRRGAVLFTDPPYGIGIVKVKGDSGLGGNGSDHTKPYGRVRQPGGQPSGILGGGDDGHHLAALRGRVSGIVRTDRIAQMRGGHPSRSGIIQPRLYPVITGDDKPFDPGHLLGLCPTAIIFGANHFASRLPDSSCWLVWDKNTSPDNSFSDAELMWTSLKGHMRIYRHTWSGLVREGSRDVESLRRLHPTQKPVGLLEQVLREFSKAGEVVVDPYLGSGSMLIACERLGRVCYGMEIEPSYVQMAIERWEGFTGRKAIKV